MLKINKNILFCAAEATPLAKVGGLADVVGSLPLALKDQGLEARVIMPAHGGINLSSLRAKRLASFVVTLGKRQESVILFQVKVNKIVYYLLQNKHYFSGNVYEGNTLDKYLFFSQAVVAGLPFLSFRPDIIHVHDFHATGVLLALASLPRFERPGLVLTIHNLQHQGWIKTSRFKSFGFNPAAIPTIAKNKAGDWINILAAGIKLADKITTVSPNYAKEILSKTYGQELEKLLISRKRDLVGILNGINNEVYNPEHDDNLAAVYNISDVALGKEKNKKALRHYFNLVDGDIPLFTLVARLSDQKGIDLFSANALSVLVRKYPFQLIILGTGEKKFENMAKSLARSLPMNVRAEIAFDNILAHNLYAGADYFLVPSRFEPCGLTQMIAMRYGAVPIVRATGGLKDTVIDGQTGLVFKDYSSDSLLKALEKALRWYYQDKTKYQALRRAGMLKDWSWQASAPAYKRLYQAI